MHTDLQQTFQDGFSYFFFFFSRFQMCTNQFIVHENQNVSGVR